MCKNQSTWTLHNQKFLSLFGLHPKVPFLASLPPTFAFAVAGPRVWNSLPPAIRDPSLSLSIFGKLLKTYLFV